LAVVNFVEGDKELIVLAQELEQVSELLSFGDVVITMRCLLWGELFGCHKSSH